MTTNTLSQDISKKAGWSLFMGFLTAVIGAVMIIYPLATATVSTLFFGWALMIAGGAQVVFAFSSDTVGNFFVKLLLGILYGIAGLALALFPPVGVLTLTWVIGVMLIADAIIELVLAFSLPVAEGRFWFVASSLVSAFLGIMIVAEWPLSAAWTIGTLLGVAVLFNGISRVVVSGTVLKGVHDFKQVAKAA
jgi:uncharacterized membrane protein HdeD (DUF308 family)